MSDSRGQGPAPDALRPPDPPPPRRRSAGRPRRPIERETLLSIARQRFAEQGYAATSMATVARHAGLSKASLFHHFPSKEDLYTEALQQTLSDLGRLIEQARLEEGSYAERLDRLSRLVVRYLGAHAEAGKLLLREMLDRGPFFHQGGDSIVQGVLEAITGFLEAGMDAGAFSRQDPRQLALSITGLHLFYFGAADIAGALVGTDLHDAQALAQREEAVLGQVRRLCLR